MLRSSTTSLRCTIRCTATRRAGIGALLTGILLACTVVAWPAPLAAAPPTALVPVRLPITGTRDEQVKGAIARRLDALRAAAPDRGVLVLRFEPAADGEAASSDFGRALELARFLASERLAGVKTVAYLPAGVAGHAVLPVLACEEIVMDPEAVLGPANATEPAIDDAMRAAYVHVAGVRRTVPAAAAVALLDPAARVVLVTTQDEGVQVVEERDLPAVRRRSAVLGAPEPLQPAPLALSGRRARDLGFVRLLAKSATELAQGLELDVRAVQAAPDIAGGWRPVQVNLSGPISANAVARARSKIERAIAEGATFVCLWIESGGGAPDQSLVLATWLASLDPATVRTVAYVPREARSDAALVALACDELVAGPDAVLGGEGDGVVDERGGEAITAAWRAGVANRRDRSWSLPVALVVPGIEVRRAERQGSGRIDYFSAAELESRADREAWQIGPAVGIGPLRLTGRRAEELGLTAHVAADFAALREAYGVEGNVALAEPGWADRLLTALASPELAWLLLLVGGAGLYIELKTPGVGLGGFVAMVAFIVYFWSQHLHGTSGWLEVMLFLAGIFCLAVEIFVLPGFGVLGLGGGLLVIASIVLASQSFILPSNDYQIRQMQWSLLGILGAVVGVAISAAALRRVLPATPVLRDVFLAPPTAVHGDEAGLLELIDAEGTATTRLAPAGKARIRGAVHDVTTEGELIDTGTAVRVVAVRGRRIVVGMA
ncbi:MAG: NfeD family protein [Planctomycetia bacterium]